MRPVAAGTGGAAEFNFDSACTTPYISAPSSPQRFGSFFYSAPTSPTRVSTFYTSHHWEETPGIPNPNNHNTTTTTTVDDDHDFAFDFSGQLDVTTADQLFDGGKIKPLKPPPPPPPPIPNQERGRERTSSRNKKLVGGGRSLSPFRVSDLLLDSEEIVDAKLDSDHPSSSSPSSSSSAAASRFSTSSLSSSFASFWYRRKWKLKDLLLFRSASDGHSMTKEQLNKYAILKQHHHQGNEELKNSSFRSTDSCGSSSTSTSSRPTPRTKGGSAVLSAHELHYRAKRAMAQDLKRKTSLPYKPAGFFGCLGFNPAADISRNFGASSTSMSREHPLPIN